MDIINYHDFFVSQTEEIKKYKWIRSEEVGYDLGQVAIFEWIKKYAKSYRDNWILKEKEDHTKF